MRSLNNKATALMQAEEQKQLGIKSPYGSIRVAVRRFG